MHEILLNNCKTSKTKSNWWPMLRKTTGKQQTQKLLAALPVVHQILFVLSGRIAQKLKAYCFCLTLTRAQKTK